MQIIFFGSFQHYSVKILESLMKTKDLEISGVFTTPSSPVEAFARAHHLPLFTPEKLSPGVDRLKAENSPGVSFPQCDLFVTAGYGKLLPPAWLSYPKHGALNLHFSLLPKYRGANPAEWAILLGESETGVTLITMSTKFDTGEIIYQKSLPITKMDTRTTLYEKLYLLGAAELPYWLTRYFDWLQKKDFACQTSLSPVPQPKVSPTPPAKRFKRDDGFIDWRIIQDCITGQKPDMTLLTGNLKTAYEFQLVKPDVFIERASRALTGFPSLWTIIPTKKGNKRLKIITCHLSPVPCRLILDTVQVEGYNPSTYNQIKNQILYV